MNRIATITAAALTAVAAFAPAAQATVFAEVPETNIISYNGLEWTWASPCAPSDLSRSCSSQDFSYQSQFGWRLPEGDEWANLPSTGLFNRTCSAAYFDRRYSHCDYSNPFWTPAAGSYSSYYETVAVREVSVDLDPNEAAAASPVPVPAALPLMLGGIGALAAARRRKG